MSDTTRPPVQEPAFRPCYRHADRLTGIACQRCGRPICNECMVEASVGFQCPGCARRALPGARTPRTRTGARLGGAGGPLTAYSAAAILVGVKVVVGLADLVSGIESQLYSVNVLVAQGEVWRLVTHSFTSGSLFNLLINALFLFLVCRSIEAEVGRWRIIAAYLLSGFGAAAVVFALGPPAAGLFGGLTALLGLLAMNAALKFRRSEDVKPDLVFLAILVGFNLALGGIFSIGGSSGLQAVAGQVLGILGGVAFGAAVGLIWTWGPRQGRVRRQVLGLLGLTGVGVLLVAGRFLVG
ncbi:rhomboid family intramembrane serine protease [Auraticoccus monumenti]|uniref:Rhomboid family protein n=1 Tax=Auraticoccus monumenti TaxID=675864 RepID=A0A1G7DTR7_9ACTN|nr:rhomboid family intramembrane serine protease [Auraticoccus monumenti]SDE54841.1 Rhomboid family protein [Auraticoccus monumenti]